MNKYNTYCTITGYRVMRIVLFEDQIDKKNGSWVSKSKTVRLAKNRLFIQLSSPL